MLTDVELRPPANQKVAAAPVAPTPSPQQEAALPAADPGTSSAVPAATLAAIVPAAPRSHGPHYLVQFGAYRSELNARTDCASFAPYAAVVVAGANGAGQWFFCRTTAPATRDEAALLVKQVKEARHGAAPIVVAATN
jgi:hypothetical protein